MSWNHRIIRERDENEDFYAIHEVYYTEKGDIQYWTELSVGPGGETLAELRDSISLLYEAFRYPVLEEREVDGKMTLVALKPKGIGE